jgi:hypothetical protein
VVTGFLAADEDDVLLINDAGVLIRTGVGSISVQGRAATGVRVMNLDGETKVAAVARVLSSEDGSDETGEQKKGCPEQQQPVHCQHHNDGIKDLSEQNGAQPIGRRCNAHRRRFAARHGPRRDAKREAIGCAIGETIGQTETDHEAGKTGPESRSGETPGRDHAAGDKTGPVGH